MAGLLIVFCFSRYRIKELVHCASAHVIGSAGPMHVPTFFFCRGFTIGGPKAL